MVRNIFIFLLLLSNVSNASSEVRQLKEYAYYTEDAPPYNYQEKNKATGISIEILENIFDHFKVKIKNKDFKFVSWPEAYSSSLKQNNSVVFLTARHQNREHLFKWVGPVISSEVVLIGRAKENYIVNNINDIHDYKIGIVWDDLGKLIISNYVGIKFLSHETHIEKLIRKLHDERVDFIVVDGKIFNHIIKRMNIDNNEFRVFYKFTDIEQYYAFSLNTPDSTITEVQNYFDEFKKSKKYSDILAKFLSN